jgi:hypothetical protein
VLGLTPATSAGPAPAARIRPRLRTSPRSGPGRVRPCPRPGHGRVVADEPARLTRQARTAYAVPPLTGIDVVWRMLDRLPSARRTPRGLDSQRGEATARSPKAAHVAPSRRRLPTEPGAGVRSWGDTDGLHSAGAVSRRRRSVAFVRRAAAPGRPNLQSVFPRFCPAGLLIAICWVRGIAFCSLAGVAALLPRTVLHSLTAKVHGGQEALRRTRASCFFLPDWP